MNKRLITEDVTGQKLADEALHRCEEGFLLLFERIPLPMWVYDVESLRFLTVNNAAVNHYGYSRAEFLAMSILDIRPPEEAVRYKKVVELMPSSLGNSGVWRHRKKDGALILVEIASHAIDFQGHKARLVFAHDVTTLRENEHRFRVIFEQAGIGIALVAPLNGQILRCNAALAKMFGYDTEELNRLTVRDVSHPGDYAEDKRQWDQMLAGEMERYQMEKRYVRRDGVLMWGLLTCTRVLNPEGKPEYLIGMVEDITERKRAEFALLESEERFRQLAENINQVFWIADLRDGKIHYLSKAYESIWGRSCQSLYQAPETWNDATHPEDRERVKHAFELSTQRHTFDEIYRILQPNGALRWIHDRGFPVYNENGERYRLVGLAEDITEQHKLEEQLRNSQKMEAMGTLAGGIAHDFNNILTAINGYGELAKMTLGKSNPKVSEQLDCILQSGRRATDLVRQILTFSRRQESNRRVIQVRDVVEETLKLLRATIPATIQFKTSFAPSLPPILADATQIHQVLMNLGINAWHAMRDRTGLLEIKVEDYEADAAAVSAQPRLRIGPYVHISVRDTGCGMDKATLERIFEPFFTTKEQGDGTGLGLSVVHGIVQSHDGLITVYSEPGVGTVFHVYFPAHEGKFEKSTSATSEITHGKGKSILYVDDEKLLAELGKATLEEIGYKVEALSDVTEALSIIRANPYRFDLVITDQTMPNMLGTDFARELQKIRPELPIILVSGYTASLGQEYLHSIGIKDLLLKPHSIHSLASTVQRVFSAMPL
jgi:PAS domain S-box-containing protein